jgi:hypothetical protein
MRGMPVLQRPKRWCALPRARHQIPERPMAQVGALCRSRLVAGISDAPARPDRPEPQLRDRRRSFARRDTAAGAEQRGRTRSLDFIELQDDAIIDRLPCLGQRGKPAPSFLHGNGPQRGSVITPFSPVYEMIARGRGSPSIINVLSEIATSTAGTQAASCSRRCRSRSIKEANDELVIRRSFWLSNELWLLN